MSTTTLRRGQRYQARKNGLIREITGFTTRPDGVRRARLQVPGQPQNETRVKVDQIGKSYQLV